MKKGVVAASTGNHGLAVAFAAKRLGISATICISQTAVEMKREGIANLGGKLIEVSGDCYLAEQTARRMADETGMTFISPYNDYAVIAGQGTIGVELFEQIPDLDVVFISVGGGGLLSGIATYLKEKKPKVKIVGCWAKNSPVLYEAIKAGKIVSVEEEPTLADALAGQLEFGSITVPLCQKLIDDYAFVSEEEIAKAIRFCADSERWMIEGSAAVAVAALHQKMPLSYPGKTAAAVICGRNIGIKAFQDML